jgi:hypothetical protein
VSGTVEASFWVAPVTIELGAIETAGKDADGAATGAEGTLPDAIMFDARGIINGGMKEGNGEGA